MITIIPDTWHSSYTNFDKNIVNTLKLVIDYDSIVITNTQHISSTGQLKVVTNEVCYWVKDEWEEDPTVIFSIINAINLFHRRPEELIKILPLDPNKIL